MKHVRSNCYLVVKNDFLSNIVGYVDLTYYQDKSIVAFSISLKDFGLPTLSYLSPHTTPPTGQIHLLTVIRLVVMEKSASFPAYNLGTTLSAQCYLGIEPLLQRAASTWDAELLLTLLKVSAANFLVHRPCCLILRCCAITMGNVF